MRPCPNCGAPANEGQSFCTICGFALNPSPSSVPASPKPRSAGPQIAIYIAMLGIATLASLTFAILGPVDRLIVLVITFVCLYVAVRAAYSLAASKALQDSQRWPWAIAVMGALLAVPASILLEVLMGGLTANVPSFLAESATLPGLWEEASKPLGILIVALTVPGFLRRKKRVFGLGIAAGLTFGIVESVFYVINGASPFLRILSVSGHSMWSAIVAVGIALAVPKISSQPGSSIEKLRGLLSAPTLTPFVLAFSLHELWDLGSGFGFLLSLPLTIVVFVGMYRYLPADLEEFRFGGPTSFVSGIFRSLRSPPPVVPSQVYPGGWAGPSTPSLSGSFAAAAPAPPYPPPPPYAPVILPNCATCGRPATYVREYNRYYCYTCARYI